MINKIKTVFNTISEFVQVFLYFYAFFAIMVWLFIIGHIPFGETLSSYFILFKNLVDKLYTPQSVDWTLVIISVFCMVLSYLLSKITETINLLMNNINLLVSSIKERQEQKEQTKAKNELRQEYLKYNQFVIGIKINVKIEEEQIYESLSQLEVSKFQSDIINKIRKCIDNANIKTFLTMGEYLIIRLRSFYDIEEFIDSINELSLKLKNSILNDEYMFSIKCYIEPLKPEDMINQEYLMKILNMNLIPKFITNEKFYDIYDEFGLKKFKVLTIGLYNIQDKNGKNYKNIELFQIK